MHAEMTITVMIRKAPSRPPAAPRKPRVTLAALAVVWMIAAAGAAFAGSVEQDYTAIVKKLRAEGIGGVDAAIAGFEEIIGRDPAFLDAYTGAAAACLLKHEFGGRQDASLLDRALAHLNAALARNPDLSEAYFRRALVFFNKGKPEDAAADLERSIKLRPGYLDPRISYTQYLLSEKKVTQARRFAESSLKNFPGDPAPAKIFGDIFLREGAGEHAVFFYRKVVGAVDRAPNTYYALGKAYQSAGDHGKAVGR